MKRERYNAGDATIPHERVQTPTTHGLKVTVVNGPDAGAAWTTGKTVAIVGRSAQADCRLNDRMVSAFHAELSVEGGGVRIADLESRNGTLHRGVKLERAVVPAGSVLEIGGSLVRVELDAPHEMEALPEGISFGELRGKSTVMRELFATMARVARTDIALLIEGETGTGKEIAARAVHAASRRASAPFIVIDCTAIPQTLAESILFGHEKGAFTGATERRLGVFEAAEGGTVFLDEIGELDPTLQPKLLRVLERREVVRVGSTQPRPVNVRVLSATWRDLRVMINAGRFREDLYYRLAQMRLVLPPLRARLDDIEILAQAMLERLPPDAEGARAIAPDAIADLARRHYPGNVRELKSTIERASMLAAGDVITQADLAFERRLNGMNGGVDERSVEESVPAAVRPSRPSMIPAAPVASGSAGGSDDEAILPFKEAKRSLVDEFERDYLQRLLKRTGGNIARAARLAGVERHYFKQLFKKHGLQVSDDGPNDS